MKKLNMPSCKSTRADGKRCKATSLEGASLGGHGLTEEDLDAAMGRTVLSESQLETLADLIVKKLLLESDKILGLVEARISE